MLKKILPSNWLSNSMPPTENSCEESGRSNEEEGPSGEPRGRAASASASSKASQPISIGKPTKCHKRTYRKSFRMLRSNAAADDETTPTSPLPDSMPEMEIIEMSPEDKRIIRDTWNVVYNEVGSTLCYVGGSSVGSSDGGNEIRRDSSEGGGGGEIEETFIRLFEEYPSSQEFFVQFRGSPIHDLKNNVNLRKTLQEHAVRVFQLVEKVIGRIDSLQKSKLILLRLGRYHRHVGIPTDYFGVMPNIFLHAVRPYLERVDMWNEDTQDAWMSLFSHITRVMTHGHNHYHLIETSAVAASTAPTTTHHYLSESTKHSAEESASALVSMSH